MKTQIPILFTILFFLSCGQKGDKCVQDKPTATVVALNEQTKNLANEIDQIVAEQYMNLTEKRPNDSLSNTIEIIAHDLYEIKENVDSISIQMVRQSIIKSNRISKYPAVADTQFSYRFVLNNFQPYFPTTFPTDLSFKTDFDKLINFQTEIIRIRKRVTDTQKGKGAMYCAEIGDKVEKSELDKVNDYWDLFNLIERTRYTLFKELLFTYSNLKYYNSEIKYKYSLSYDDTIPDITKWTPK